MRHRFIILAILLLLWCAGKQARADSLTFVEPASKESISFNDIEKQSGTCQERIPQKSPRDGTWTTNNETRQFEVVWADGGKSTFQVKQDGDSLSLQGNSKTYVYNLASDVDAMKQAAVRGKEVQCLSHIRQLCLLMMQYSIDHGDKWPGKFEDLADYSSKEDLAKLLQCPFTPDANTPGYDIVTSTAGKEQPADIILRSRAASERDNYAVAQRDGSCHLEKKKPAP